MSGTPVDCGIERLDGPIAPGRAEIVDEVFSTALPWTAIGLFHCCSQAIKDRRRADITARPSRPLSSMQRADWSNPIVGKWVYDAEDG